MLNVYSNNIELTRGDTAVLNFDLTNYKLKDADVVVLTVKKNVNSESNLFQVTLNHTSMQFVIQPSNTNTLKYGNYKYDIQLTTATNEVYTVVTPHDFKLEAEVTW